eukprot:4983188-Amphidinium_carterae.1
MPSWRVVPASLSTKTHQRSFITAYGQSYGANEVCKRTASSGLKKTATAFPGLDLKPTKTCSSV